MRLVKWCSCSGAQRGKYQWVGKKEREKIGIVTILGKKQLDIVKCCFQECQFSTVYVICRKPKLVGKEIKLVRCFTLINVKVHINRFNVSESSAFEQYFFWVGGIFFTIRALFFLIIVGEKKPKVLQSLDFPLKFFFGNSPSKVCGRGFVNCDSEIYCTLYLLVIWRLNFHRAILSLQKFLFICAFSCISALS